MLWGGHFITSRLGSNRPVIHPILRDLLAAESPRYVFERIAFHLLNICPTFVSASDLAKEFDVKSFRSVRVEQVYKGNFHLLCEVEGRERKYVIARGKE